MIPEILKEFNFKKEKIFINHSVTLLLNPINDFLLLIPFSTKKPTPTILTASIFCWYWSTFMFNTFALYTLATIFTKTTSIIWWVVGIYECFIIATAPSNFSSATGSTIICSITIFKNSISV